MSFSPALVFFLASFLIFIPVLLLAIVMWACFMWRKRTMSGLWAVAAAMGALAGAVWLLAQTDILLRRTEWGAVATIYVALVPILLIMSAHRLWGRKE
jgi:hypothetical protein